MQRLYPEQFPIPVDRITKLLRVIVVGGAVIAASCASVPKGGGSDATAQGEGDGQGEGKTQGKSEGKSKTGDQGTGSRSGQGTSQGGTSQGGGSDPGGVRGW